MANGISFNISAVDKATATIKKINDSVSKMTRPYSNLSRSMKQFTDVSGLKKLGSALGSLKNMASSVASSFAKIGAPLLALVGGGTIAGLIEMVSNFAKLGAELERTSQLLGISAQNLNAMRGAAQLMGVSGDDMTSGFKSLADTLQDAKWGRNQAAYVGLQALGIRLHETKTGAIDTEQAMLDLADRIHQVQKVDPAAARNLARMFGVENLLPMLSKGGAAMRQYQEEAKRLKGVFTPEMAARATDFSIATSKMMLSIEGVKTSIADKLMPVIQPLMTHFTKWISKNREFISTKVAEYIGVIAKILDDFPWDVFWIGVDKSLKAVGEFSQKLISFIDSIGGIKTILIAVGVYMAGSFVLSIVAATAQIVFLAKAFGGLDMAMLPMLGKLGSIASVLSKIALTAYAAHKALEFFDPNDNLGSWVDKNVPGAAAVDNFASKFGMGRSYDEQAHIAGGVSQRSLEWRSKLNLDEKESRYGLPKGMLTALMEQESSGNASAVSGAGARGLFQFMPETAREYGIDAMDPSQSSEAAAKKLSGLAKRYGGDYTKALSAYNWGEGNLDRKGLNNAPDETKKYAPQIYGRMDTLNNSPSSAPTINVQNTVNIDKNGNATITTKTPSSSKVERVMAGDYQ